MAPRGRLSRPDGHYHIAGAEPRSFHVVGIHSFDPDGRCLHRFGQFSQRDGCWFSITRQSVFAPVAESFDATMIAVDGDGNGDLDFTWTNVDPGAYHLAFHLRHAAGVATCPCPVTHQAPGPFATTIPLTIP